MKYEDKDFEKIVKGKSTIDDVCKKYGVKKTALIKAMNRRGYFMKKKKFIIVSPHKTKVVYSYRECADELNVSIETIRNAVKGKHIKLFSDMGVRLEVVDDLL